MSPPVGPTGLPRDCTGAEASAAWRIGAAAGGFSTEIDFPNDREVRVQETSLLASVGWHPSARWGIALAAGPIGDGTIVPDEGRAADVRPGFAASLSGSFLASTEAKVRPFLLFGMSLAYSRATTEGGADLTAGDARISVLFGKTFFDLLAPYWVARVFGGPVTWDRIEGTGGDAHHWAIGLGLTLRLPANFDVVAEAIPFGEQSWMVGVGFEI